MKAREFLSKTPAETIAFGKAFAKDVRPGTVLALTGDLGTGKTTFIKGLALGLGLKDQDEVKSPTFALMHVYDARMPIYHFDLYRLDTVKEIQAIGFDELVSDPSAVTVIEWAEKAGVLLPPGALRLSFEQAGENSRRISFTGLRVV